MQSGAGVIGLPGALRLLALTAVLVAATWTHSLHTQLNAANAKVDALTARAALDRDRTAQLTNLLDHERATQARLLTVQRELRQGLAHRQRTLERLTHENAALRHWAAQPLPDPARRLRERPALTGADAYRQWLSGGDPLPATADTPDP